MSHVSGSPSLHQLVDSTVSDVTCFRQSLSTSACRLYCLRCHMFPELLAGWTADRKWDNFSNQSIPTSNIHKSQQDKWFKIRHEDITGSISRNLCIFSANLAAIWSTCNWQHVDSKLSKEGDWIILKQSDMGLFHGENTFFAINTCLYNRIFV